jgi:hypothetical protein
MCFTEKPKDMRYVLIMQSKRFLNSKYTFTYTVSMKVNIQNPRKMIMYVMSTHASVLVDSVGPPSVEVCRAAANFP